MSIDSDVSSIDIAAYDLHLVEPVLRVRNVEETVEWYRTRLGFAVDFIWGEPAEHAGVSATGNGGCVRIQFSVGLADGIEPTVTGWLMIRVGADIDRLYEAYKARGVVIVRAIDTRPWGLRDFDILDCNGHVLRFAGEV